MKDQAAENKLPSFDLGRKAGQKIRLQTHRRAIILCVVDVADFDGSLPRAALSGLLETIGYGDEAPNASPRELGHQLVVAVNKIDLLPTQISVKRLEVGLLEAPKPTRTKGCLILHASCNLAQLNIWSTRGLWLPARGGGGGGEGAM